VIPFAEIKVFGGTAHPALVKEICEYLGVPAGSLLVEKFSDGECHVQVLENVRGADVFVIQPTNPPAENLLELLLLIDAFKRSSAERITAVIPYYGYARQERKDKPRVPISAKLIADLIVAAGAHRVLTMDLHAPAIQGFFNVPVDHLYAMPVLIRQIEAWNLPDLTIVSPDAGGVERARMYAKRCKAELAIIDKRRSAPNVAESIQVIGDVAGRHCVITDDIVDTAGTLAGAVKALMAAGAASVRGCFTHPVLSGQAIERLMESSITAIAVTNTIPLDESRRSCEKIEVLSVAPLLGEAIRRTHTNSSISSLFV